MLMMRVNLFMYEEPIPAAAKLAPHDISKAVREYAKVRLLRVRKTKAINTTTGEKDS